MKALISPNELFIYTWTSSWENQENKWVPVISEIFDCQRIAQVEPNDKIFDVAEPLFWLGCSDNCEPDVWYFKDGQFYVKPLSVPVPETPVVNIP